MDLQNSKTHVKCCSKSQMLVFVSAPNGDFVSSLSSSSNYNGSNSVLQKKVSIFRITVSLLLARNNKYQNFKNPTLELTWSSRLSCLFFFLLSACYGRVFQTQFRESCWRRRQAGKKKMVAVLLGVDLSRDLPCPIFSQIFSVFGNKDSFILNENCWFCTYGTRRWTCCRGPVICCHIHGVKTLFHTMVWK